MRINPLAIQGRCHHKGKGTWLLVRTLIVAAISGIAIVGCARHDDEVQGSSTPLPLGRLLADTNTKGFERAMAPRTFSFPADHGPHLGFRSEWWYVTGQVTGTDEAGRDRRFGYQLTFFRQALAPDAPARRSDWATRQVYMAHLAVTDVEGRRFAAFERLSRAAVGLAGARVEPFRVWVEDWEMTGPDRGGSIFPLTLRARAQGSIVGSTSGTADAVELALMLAEGRGPILQGDAGLSVKGPEPGNASYYYSVTRLPARGTLMINGELFQVAGTGWLDREWSTSALGADLAGWDWLALHLSDGRDLMVYRLRRKDGQAAPESRATVIDAVGGTRSFSPKEFELVTRGEWRSPRTGISYPTTVLIRIPSLALELEVKPLLTDQELALSVRYWEGAVVARGQVEAGAAISGEGYLELTGYSP